MEQEKQMFQTDVDAEIRRWAGEDYNPNNIRHLLQNLHVRPMQCAAPLLPPVAAWHLQCGYCLQLRRRRRWRGR